ncbi:MAG: ABC transporter permease [Dorea sp.]
MSWIDLLRMSASNLKRRKLRTFLTVLGVVIGTASIVVMVSLGLGLQKSVYDEMEQSGGLTTINVTGSGSVGDGMMYSSNSDNLMRQSNILTQLCEKIRVRLNM